jgi:hypothetical protein
MFWFSRVLSARLAVMPAASAARVPVTAVSGTSSDALRMLASMMPQRMSAGMSVADSSTGMISCTMHVG